VIDFVAIRGSQLAEFVDANTVRLTNVELPTLPNELKGSFDTLNWFRVYINSEWKEPTYYSYSADNIAKTITFDFSGLGFDLDINDEVAITGKFLEL